jgi:mono/diheme cytochrome c family protein
LQSVDLRQYKFKKLFYSRSTSSNPAILVAGCRKDKKHCSSLVHLPKYKIDILEGKRMSTSLKMLPLLLILVSFFPALAAADTGKELFEKQCASCHTIGGGDSGGPDLKGVTTQRSAAWLERIITAPDKLAADKDPVQMDLVKKFGFEMPNLGINRDDAGKIIAYLKGGALPEAVTGKASPAAEQPNAKTVEIATTPEMIATGKALFIGRKRLSNGGAPCVACHAFSYPGIQGGSLAADLTGLYTKMGEQGVRGVLKSLKFPVMKKVFADRPLTDEEINALIAFIKDAAVQKGAGSPALFPLTGVALFALFMIALTLYKRRIR